VAGTCCLIALFLAAPATEAEWLAQADAAFAEGLAQNDHPSKARPHFRRAAEAYEQLQQLGCRNAELARNTGNAWLLTGDVARAIFAYRRGLHLAPGDRDLRVCLAHAREQVNHSAPGGVGRAPVEHRPPWLPHVSPWLWLAGIVAAYGLACICLARSFMTQTPALRRLAWLLLLPAIVCAVLLVLEARSERKENEHPLVVIAEDGVLLRKGDGLNYPLRVETPLNAGVEARRRVTRGEWLQIELAGGEIGWVPRRYALVDER
jgi:hypothetical protein